MKEKLKQMGLTEGESKTYLSLLKIGSSTVGPIVKDSRISYSKIYDVLNRLLDKGIISYTIREKTKYFQAANPNRLLDYLEKQQNQIKSNKKILKEIIPDLQKIKNKKVLQESEIFTGLNGIKAAYEILTEDYFKEDPFLYFYVHDEKYADAAELIYDQIFHYFKKINLKLKGISSFEFRNSKYYKKHPTFIDLRFVDFPIPGTIDIYQDKILQVSLGETPTAILIRSKEIADNYRKYFNDVWKVARK
jgi:sugar-specific transcriptional regulator TrmB